MRLSWLVMALISCSASHQSSTSASVQETPCPACPSPAYSPTACPAPIICPISEGQPGPAVQDWFCIRLERTTPPTSTYCWHSQSACEFNRMLSIRRRHGKPGPCITQSIAHCMEAVISPLMSRQIFCASNEADCLRRRNYYVTNPPIEHYTVSECRPLRNQFEPFSFSELFAPAEAQ